MVSDAERATLGQALSDTFEMWRALWYYWARGGSFADAPHFSGTSTRAKHARVHVFSLALTMRLWGRPHYRAGSYRDDALANLSNVAIPGTGIPLSWLAQVESRSIPGTASSRGPPARRSRARVARALLGGSCPAPRAPAGDSRLAAPALADCFRAEMEDVTLPPPIPATA